jgi:adenylate cyclase
MNTGASESPVRRFLVAAREYLTHASISGAIVVLTGFAPEHWFADLIKHLAIPESLRQGWLQGFDIRIGLVAVGIAIIAWDVLRRSRPRRQKAPLDGRQEAPAPLQTPDRGRDDQKQVHATDAATPALPEKPSIAVLPFQNLSSDPEQEIFADGLVEDIITTLSKLSGLSVIARNSSFVYKGKTVDVRAVAKELGVRYVLEGSVRKGGDRIRITAQLIDARSGSHVWAERYDRKMEDIFAIQDEITLILATEMQVSLLDGEQARLRYSTTKNVEAWTYWAQGLAHYRQPVTKDQLGAARPCWEKALALDPDSAALHAMLGFMHYADARFGWWDDRETALGKARAYADKALALDPQNADAYTTSSLVLMMRGRYEEAVAHARKAVELAPGSADAATFACFVLASSGSPQEALVQIRRAMSLSPIYPATYLGHLGNACRLSGRIEEAITAFKGYDARSPGFGLTDLVIAYQQSGQPEQAKLTAERLLSARPKFTIESWKNTQFRADTAQLEADIAALRAAELPVN